MRTRTKTMVIAAVLVAVMLIFGFTPLGYIPLPFAKITLMCVPLIIGVLCIGWKAGLVLSGIFIFTSIFQLLTAPDAVSLILFQYSPAYVLTLIIPRLAIPFVVLLVSRITANAKRGLSYALCAVAGSLTNTVLYLAMLQLFFVQPLSVAYTVDSTAVAAIIWTVALTNGLPEAAVAGIVCTPVVKALKRSA